MLIIIDYGLGNMRSVQKAFERLNIEVVVSGDKALIEKGTKYILPGVGHFVAGMKNLRDRDLIEVLNHRVLVDKVPILGICLGMQLMTNHSEEGDCQGLEWIDANTRRFNLAEFDKKLKIPHMGWNTLSVAKDSSLLQDIEISDTFYFVHSYRVVCHHPADILAKTGYGIEFVSAFQRDNIWGVQFHPEKSHKAGLRLLQNFASL
jgi:imidazole glycerol-phosphate synthase subunit HisH